MKAGKRIAALVLAGVMVFGNATPAMAANVKDASFKFSAGTKYTASEKKTEDKYNFCLCESGQFKSKSQNTGLWGNSNRSVRNNEVEELQLQDKGWKNLCDCKTGSVFFYQNSCL